MSSTFAVLHNDGGIITLEGQHDEEMLDAARCVGRWYQYPTGAGLDAARQSLALCTPAGWLVTHDFMRDNQPFAPEGAKVVKVGGWGQRSRDALSCADLYIYKGSV